MAKVKVFLKEPISQHASHDDEDGVKYATPRIKIEVDHDAKDIAPSCISESIPIGDNVTLGEIERFCKHLLSFIWYIEHFIDKIVFIEMDK